MMHDEQSKIINADINTVNIVTAGPGSGKTSVLVNRGLYLLQNLTNNSHKILLLTYSREACNQLRDRLSNNINNNLEHFKIDTYHSLSFYLLKRYYKLLGYSNAPKKANDKEIISLIDNFMISNNSNQFNQNGRDVDSKALLRTIKTAKERFFNQSTSDDPIEMCFQTLENSESFLNLYRHIQRSLKDDNKLMDFQDMIIDAITLLKSDVNRNMILNEMQFKYLLVDEFQDTNYKQLQLLKLIMDPRQPNLTVVGDRDQLIYKFQGANENNWIELRKHLNALKVDFTTSQLNNNFRSSDIIVKCSNIIINSNKLNSNVKRSVAVGKYCTNSTPISIIECSTEKDQYYYIVTKIKELTAANSSNQIAINEIAVLYRNNNKGDAFMSYVSNECPDIKINHKKSIDVTNITENGERKSGTLINKLKLIINLDNNDALRNCIPTTKNDKCKEVVLNIINNAMKHNGSIFHAINNAVQQKMKHISSLNGFCNSILGLRNWVSKNEITLSDFIAKVCTSIHDTIDPDDLTTVKLLDIIDKYAMKNTTNLSQELPNFILHIEQSAMNELIKPGLNVSTIHCAKGLEFRCVFILEANHDIFQSNQNGTDNELELLYVAISRAKERLFITWICNNNNIHNGITEFLKPLLKLPTDKVVQEFFASSAQTSKPSGAVLPSTAAAGTKIVSKFVKSSELLNSNGNFPAKSSNQFVRPLDTTRTLLVQFKKPSSAKDSSAAIISSTIANTASNSSVKIKKYKVPLECDNSLCENSFSPQQNGIDHDPEVADVKVHQILSDGSNENSSHMADIKNNSAADENSNHDNRSIGLDTRSDNNKSKPFSFFGKFIPQSSTSRKREREII